MTQDLSDLKLEEWERIAREATPGPHEARFMVGGAPTDCCDYGIVSLTEGRETCRVWRRPDVEFYAAFDPPTVLSLLSALKEAREALRPFAKIAGHLTSCAYGPAWGFNGGVVEHEDFLKARKAFTTLGGSDEQAE